MDIHSLLLGVFYKPVANIQIDFPARMHVYTHYIDDYTFYLFLHDEGIRGWDAFTGNIRVNDERGLEDLLHIDIPVCQNGVFCRRVCTRIRVKHVTRIRTIMCPLSVRGFSYSIEGGDWGGENVILVAHAQYLSSHDFRLVIQRVDSFSGWKNAGHIVYTFGGKRYKGIIEDSDDIISYTIRTCPNENLEPSVYRAVGGQRITQPVILENIIQDPVILSCMINTVYRNPGAVWEGVLIDDFRGEFTGTEYLDAYLRLSCNIMKVQLWSYMYLYKYGGAVIYPNVVLYEGCGTYINGKAPALEFVRTDGFYTGYIFAKKQNPVFSEVLQECKKAIEVYSPLSPEHITGSGVLESCFKKIYGSDESSYFSCGIYLHGVDEMNNDGLQNILVNGGRRFASIMHSIMSGDVYNILQDAYNSGSLYLRKVQGNVKPFMNGTIKGSPTNITIYVHGNGDEYNVTGDIINDNTLSIRVRKAGGGRGGWTEKFNVFIEDKDEGRIQKKVIEPSSESEKVIQCRVPWTLKGIEEYEQKIPKDIYITWKDYYLDSNIYDSYTSIIEYNPEYSVHMYSDNNARAFLAKHYKNDVISAYDALIPGSFKADLWRYCVLYEKGGVYVDHKVKFRGSLRDVIGRDDEMVFPLDADKKHVQIGFMGFIPKHPLLKYVIDKTVANIKKEMVGQRDLEITGPIHFARCCMEFYAMDSLKKEVSLCKEHRWLWLNDDASHIYTGEGALVANYHYKEYLSTRKDHYSYFWNNKTIYKIDSMWLQ